ncbi:response regulator receiver protein [Thalassotalea sp. ND16A]|nr:response regulator receiver protein [Thalassotalea sp. ND16A]
MNGNKKNILYVEDDLKLAKLVSDFLQKSGFNIKHADSGCLASYDAQTNQYDLILLDIGLPDTDGFSVFKEIKANQNTPIIFMTARQNQLDHVKGLNLGADDYLTKPVSPSILIARINTCLRRTPVKNKKTPLYSPQNLLFGALTINKIQRDAYLDGVALELTTAEFDLLVQLASDAGNMISREQLFDTAIGREYDGLNRTVDGRISRLRKKLGDDESPPTKIKTVWGKGYILVPEAWL